VDLSPNGLFITKDGATCQLMVLTLRNSGGPASLILDITSVDAKVRYLSERLDNVAAGTVTRELAFPALDEPRAVKVTLSRPGPSPKVLLILQRHFARRVSRPAAVAAATVISPPGGKCRAVGQETHRARG
jgi:hypothetical protein